MNTATMATQHLLHNLILRQLRRTTTATLSLHHPNHHPTVPHHSHNRPLTTTTLPLLCTLQQTPGTITELKKTEVIKDDDDEEEVKTVRVLETREVPEVSAKERKETEDIKDDDDEKEGKIERVLETREVPELSVKERKELGSYAQSLGDKLKAQQIGKTGVTGNVAFALDETLESNELVKLKIHRSCPGELEDVIRQLEQATGSVVVGQIGRTVILYRPSVTKLKAEQKKEQNRKIFEQKRKKFLANPSVVQRWRK